MRRGWKFALGALALAALVWFGMTGLVRSYVFRPHLAAEPEWTGTPPQSIRVTTADGLTLSGYYWPAKGANDLLIVFHGNGGSQQQFARYARPLTEGGHGVLIASYRGYGGNPGTPTEAGLFTDGDAWITRARALLAPGGKLYVYGHSLGGGVALEMAARHRIDGVATLGTFTRVADMAPGFARPFVLDRFDNMAAIRRIRAPVVLFHGDRDSIIPYALAPRLAAASGGRARLVRLPGEDHSVAFSKMAPLLRHYLHKER